MRLLNKPHRPDMAHKETQNASVQHSNTGVCNRAESDKSLSTIHQWTLSKTSSLPYSFLR